jgi:isopenicillin N synthase-like dioxygenase
MKLDVIAFHDLTDPKQHSAHQTLEKALLERGVVGISGVPGFKEKSRAFVDAALRFSQLPDDTKQKYQPNRDAGDTEGYELGAEWFKDQHDEWQVDDKKASYYACVPNDPRNKWPTEIDLKTPYLELAELIFNTGKVVLNLIGLNESMGLNLDWLTGYGRMLHYHKESDLTNNNPNWCGGHFDHGIFTGLMPAYYFQNGQACEEPEEAGLNIDSRDGKGFQKVYVPDQSVVLFQAGEFGQLISDDRIRATKHLVKKSFNGIDRFALAVFTSIDKNYVIRSKSELTKDQRYSENQSSDGSISFGRWEEASFARYRAM